MSALTARVSTLDAGAGITRLELPDGSPEVRLLDARAAELDEPVLRRWARSQRQADAETFVSRSYRYPYALVAWHSERVGIDIERLEECEPAFLDSICTPSERRAYPNGSTGGPLSVWCGKEALSKALGDALNYDPRRLDSPLRWPDGRCGAWRAAQLPAPAGHVAWICWR